MGPRSIEFWLWPNVLSLDAPAIAMLWQVTLARCLRVRVPPVITIALGMSVWVLYVADRILDGMSAPSAAHNTARHRFYRRHRERAAMWAAVLAILVVSLALAWFPPKLLRDYLVLAFGVAVYFGIVHAAPRKLRACLPKELAVAVFFALGVCLPVAATHCWPLFAAFATLLWMNTLAIDTWESAHWEKATHSKLSPLIGICAALGFFCAFGALFATPQRVLWTAIALSSALLAVLGRFRFRLSPNAIRVLADTALLTPLLLLFR